MALKKGEDLKIKDWLIPTLPKFSVKKGPIDFIEKL